MRIELSVEVTYLPHWGCFEGARELIQNGKDGEIQFQAPLEVRHRAESNVLVIENTGCALSHEALLFGHTTKEGQAELRGKFGEGLKIGSLALVRAGYSVKIRSGAEVWTPKIEKSEKFNADVLVFYIEKGRQPKNRIQIEISSITREEWELMRTCFLFLNETKVADRVDTDYGALLLGESYSGKVFVKGIFVENNPNIKVGYDFTKDVEVDRDRKMVNRYDFDWRTQVIWREALVRREDLITKYLGMVQENTGDVANLSAYNASLLPEKVKTETVAQFKAQHGEHAVPVETLAESKDIAHLGKKGVLVSKPLGTILQAVLGTIDQVKAKLADEVLTHYAWDDLTEVERVNLEEIIALVNTAEPITLAEVDVVAFRSPELLGMFKESRLLLKREDLSDWDRSLENTIHELAHKYGSDGSPKHVAAIERIWSKLYHDLRASEAT